LGVTLLGDCAEQLGRKPEILERRFDVNLLMFIRRRTGRCPLLKTAPEFGLGRTLPSHRFRQRNCYGKFGELGKNREEAVTLTG
jgi:hypothetical protein